MWFAIITMAFPVYANSEIKNSEKDLNEKKDIKKIDDKWIFSFLLENDLFSEDDDNYTSGIRFSLLSPEYQKSHWIEKIAAATPFFDEFGKKRVSYSFGQSIYTPENILSKAIVPDERPYAGWLYGSVGLVSDTGSRLERLELTAGMVGPSSLAYQSQRDVHHVRGFLVPRGWDNQLKDEPGFILSYENAWKKYSDFGLFGMGGDVTPKIGFSLGNVHTNFSLGTSFRLGANLPADYGPPKIRPRMSGSDYFSSSKDFGWYLFADIEGRAVARNIFLDGNSFRDSHSVDKQVFVADAQLGLAMTLDDYRLAYTHVFRTKEFDTQNNAIESFGAITFSIRY